MILSTYKYTTSTPHLLSNLSPLSSKNNRQSSFFLCQKNGDAQHEPPKSQFHSTSADINQISSSSSSIPSNSNQRYITLKP
ncbi:hypothetical protein Hanom_Chr03g00234011 [Helianthus anomalus]